ncbi:myosin heavy chain, clone 203-like [Clytia hemisphaerica]|uniref:myosin heavy chain, clone 203-like n=1 Tax=Clytia hemisphaerica TaxID=252671 RepID=UPI0034D5FB23
MSSIQQPYGYLFIGLWYVWKGIIYVNEVYEQVDAKIQQAKEVMGLTSNNTQIVKEDVFEVLKEEQSSHWELPMSEEELSSDEEEEFVISYYQNTLEIEEVDSDEDEPCFLEPRPPSPRLVHDKPIISLKRATSHRQLECHSQRSLTELASVETGNSRKQSTTQPIKDVGKAKEKNGKERKTPTKYELRSKKVFEDFQEGDNSTSQRDQELVVLRREIDALKARQEDTARKHANEISKYRAEVRTVKKQSDEKNLKITDLRMRIKEMKKECTDYEWQISESENTVKQGKAENEELKKALESATDKIDSLEKNNQELVSDNDQLEEILKRSKVKNGVLRDTLKSARIDVESLNKRNQDLESSNLNLKNKFDKSNKENVKLRSVVKTARIELESLNKSNKVLASVKSSLDEKLHKFNEENQELKKLNIRFSDEKNALSNSNKTLTSELVKMRLDLGFRETVITKSRQELTHFKSKCEFTRIERDHLRNHLQITKSEKEKNHNRFEKVATKPSTSTRSKKAFPYGTSTRFKCIKFFIEISV